MTLTEAQQIRQAINYYEATLIRREQRRMQERREALAKSTVRIQLPPLVKTKEEVKDEAPVKPISHPEASKAQSQPQVSVPAPAKPTIRIVYSPSYLAKLDKSKEQPKKDETPTPVSIQGSQLTDSKKKSEAQAQTPVQAPAKPPIRIVYPPSYLAKLAASKKQSEVQDQPVVQAPIPVQAPPKTTIRIRYPPSYEAKLAQKKQLEAQAQPIVQAKTPVQASLKPIIRLTLPKQKSQGQFQSKPSVRFTLPSSCESKTRPAQEAAVCASQGRKQAQSEIQELLKLQTCLPIMAEARNALPPVKEEVDFSRYRVQAPYSSVKTEPGTLTLIEVFTHARLQLDFTRFKNIIEAETILQKDFHRRVENVNDWWIKFGKNFPEGVINQELEEMAVAQAETMVEAQAYYRNLPPRRRHSRRRQMAKQAQMQPELSEEEKKIYHQAAQISALSKCLSQAYKDNRELLKTLNSGDVRKL